MTNSLRWLLAAAVLTGGLALTVAPATASKSPAPKGNSGVIDGAKLFSADAVTKAIDRVARVRDDYGKGLFIETIDEAENKAAVEKMAERKYNERKIGGVYVLICKQPSVLWIEVGKETRKKAFTQEDRRGLVGILEKNFKANEFDTGLAEGISYVAKTYDANIGKLSTQAVAGGKTAQAPTKSNFNWLGLICIGLAVALGIWMVFALVRALTRPAAPAGGPGYAGGGGGGGGGGGFMSSMLGGLFGAAAGMYLYDSFFRSNTPMGGGMTPSAYGGDSPAAPDDSAGGGGGGDYGGGGDAGAGGGGDWGDKGDAGGGGGDWGGGGGDAGGGGDWGGGGGGGGDW